MHKFDFFSGILIGVSLIIISFNLVMSWHQNFITYIPNRAQTLDLQTTDVADFSQTKTAQRLIISQLLSSEQLGHDMSTSFASVTKDEGEKTKICIVNKAGEKMTIDEVGLLITSTPSLFVLCSNHQWMIEVAHD